MTYTEIKSFLDEKEFIYSSIEKVNEKELLLSGCENPTIKQQLHKIVEYFVKNDITGKATKDNKFLIKLK